jgi:serine/threonine protein kinase
MVCEDGDGNYVIKLIDLDFVKTIDHELIEIPENEVAKNRLGTRQFMAPELFLTEPYKGEPVDVFAIGVTLFVMFVIDHPFQVVYDENDHY